MDDEVVFGLHAVLAALQQHPDHLDVIWLAEQRHDRRIEAIVEAARAGRVRLQRVPRARVDELAGDPHHQGVAARLRRTPVGNEQDLSQLLAGLTEPALVLILDGVQDPHNLGACLRSADAAGVHAVVLPRDRSAPITGAVRRTAAGAAETVPVFRVTNLVRTLEQLKHAGLWLAGATGDASTPLYEADLAVPLALVLGGEGRGLRRLTREACDLEVAIPMYGRLSSLNVSVAAGICLYEAARQRHQRR